MKRKKCKIDGCTNPVWSGGLCQNHIGRKPLKKTKTLYVKSDKKGIEKFQNVVDMHTFFLSIWKKREHVSEISGEKLGKEPSSAYFHHIIPKSKFPDAAYDEKNIILLTMDEHANVEMDMFKYKEINIRRKELLKKYNLI